MHREDFDQLPPPGDIESSRQRFFYCANKGLLKHAVPKEFNGFGNTFCDLINLHETLGQGCRDCGLVLSINAHLWGAVFPLLHYGTQEQKDDWLPKLVTGELIAGHAITEPQAGSDLNALKSEAVASDHVFVLNGHKRFITNTPLADVLVIYASIEKKLSAFIVKKDDPGVQFRDNPCVTGCYTATMGDVVLENCIIPASRQLGKTGAGNLMIQHALELERAFIFAGIAGIMNWQLDTVVRYSRERSVNEAHLGKNQAISHRIADMKLRLDTIRLWVEKCARLIDNDKRITIPSAQTKLYAGEAFLQSSLDAIQILGSSGLLVKHPLNGMVSDAMASRLFSGSSEIQKNIIASMLGTGDGYKSRPAR